jgi:hypothetical protein
MREKRNGRKSAKASAGVKRSLKESYLARTSASKKICEMITAENEENVVIGNQ